jgi:catechol 2,3-dioxygenase-like lactoylglutathione lyase family enzyme
VRIVGLDCLVLTVRDLDATVAFLERLGMRRRLRRGPARARADGATGTIPSVDVRDPDGNLVRLSTRA